MRRKLAAGNWKMNGTSDSLHEVETLSAMVQGRDCDVLICPPATLIDRVKRCVAGTGLLVGGQDSHHAAAGAHTGNVSAAMLHDAGATHVILGHSERRTDHREDDVLVRAKVEAALAAGLVALVCVGESEDEREARATLTVVGTQLAGSLPDGTSADTVVVAYEPVWAIGTGKTPSDDEIAEVHGFMRTELTRRFGVAGAGIRLLYGGSVKPANAAAIFALPDVDGALVGGASLKAADFGAIIDALVAAPTAP